MATMNKAIEQYMAQGYSRVQAIKLFYEKIKNQKSTLSPTPSADQADTPSSSKKNRLSLPPQTGKVKYAIERFNANKNAEIVGPEVKRNPDAPASKWGALKSKLKSTRPNLAMVAAAALAAKNGTASPDIANNTGEGSNAGSGANSRRASVGGGGSDTEDLMIDIHESSPIRGEGQNHVFGRGASPKNFDSNHPPLSVGRTLNLVPMSQIHRKFFPNSQEAGEQDEDEDEDDDDDDYYDGARHHHGEDNDDVSLDTAEPTPENVLAFLHTVKYSSEERDEFLIMIDKGRDIDEAAHAIFVKRLRAYEKAGQEMQLKPGERLPLRYSSITGHRSNDLEVLLRHNYTLPQANYVLDAVYAWQQGAKDAPPPLKPTLGSIASSGKVALAVQKFSSLRKKTNAAAEAGAEQHHSTANVSLAKLALLQAAKAQKEGHESHVSSAAGTPERDHRRRVGEDVGIEVKQTPSLDLDDLHDAEDEAQHAMDMAMLITEQEELYGINMYDCLEPADEDKIEELCSAGMPVDDAILSIFEEKVVRPFEQHNAIERPLTPSQQSHHSNQSSHHSNKTPPIQPQQPEMSAQRLADEFNEQVYLSPPAPQPAEQEEEEEYDNEDEEGEQEALLRHVTPPAMPRVAEEDEVDYQIAEDLELEIALLMRKGYSREAAVRFLLDRTSEEVMQVQPEQNYSSTKPATGYEAMTPPSTVSKDPSRSRTTSTADPGYTYPTMMMPGSHQRNGGSSSSVGSGSRSSGGRSSGGNSPAVSTPPINYSSRRPSVANGPQRIPSNGDMQHDMYGYPAQQQGSSSRRPSVAQRIPSHGDMYDDGYARQQSSSSRRPSMAVDEYGQPRYDQYEHSGPSGKHVPYLNLPSQQDAYRGVPPYTEITVDDEDDDDISHLTDPTTMTGPTFPLQQQFPQPPQQMMSQYPPQPQYSTQGPQGIQYASYPPQPPPQQIQQHIYVNPVQQAYRPPPPKPPVIHINPQAPLLPMQYNTNLPTHLHIYNRQDDRNLSNINADERALRIGLLVSEQESQYGINMYDDIHAGDEPFLNRLIQSGYNEDEAVLVIFEIKHGPPNSHYVSRDPQPMQNTMKRQQSGSHTPQPPSRPAPIIHINSNNSNSMNSPAPFHLQSSTSSKHNSNHYSNGNSMNSPAPFHHQTSNNNNNYNQSNTNNNNAYHMAPSPPQRGVTHNSSQPQHTRSLMGPSPNASHNNSMDSLEFAMQMSRKESEFIPGAVRMPGMNDRGAPQRRPSQHNAPSNVSYADVDPESLRTLTGMGFGAEMAAYALRNKNHDVNQALEYLLGSA